VVPKTVLGIKNDRTLGACSRDLQKLVESVQNSELCNGNAGPNSVPCDNSDTYKTTLGVAGGNRFSDQSIKIIEQPFHATKHSPEKRCSGFSFMDDSLPVTTIGIE